MLLLLLWPGSVFRCMLEELAMDGCKHVGYGKDSILLFEAAANELVQLWLDGFHVYCVYEVNTELEKISICSIFFPPKHIC